MKLEPFSLSLAFHAVASVRPELVEGLARSEKKSAFDPFGAGPSSSAGQASTGSARTVFSWVRTNTRRGLLALSATAALAALSLNPPAVLAQVASTPSVRSGSLPSLGDGGDFSAGRERRMGDKIAASIYRDPDYLDDPVLADYLQAVWKPLVVAARARGELSPELDERFAMELMLIRNRTINAFALPGGYLGVHTGLIGAVSSADELAAVLAHELSHVTQRHISRLMTQQERQAPWIIAAMILGALAASKNPEAANAAIVGGQAVAVQNQLNFSRDMEREADRVGFGVMTDAGFQSRGVAAMFEKLQQASRLNDNGSFPYLRSHPLTTERIAEVQARLQSAPSPARPASPDLLHAMMSARARVLSDPGIDVLRNMLGDAQRAMAAGADQAALAGALYGGALAAGRVRDTPASQTYLARLKQVAANDAKAATAARLLAIELDGLAGRNAAPADLAFTAASPSRAELLVQGRALLAVNRASEVIDKLQTWVATNPRDAAAWQLLAEAYGRQNEVLRAIRADAESRVAQLDYSAALDRLKAAQARARQDTSAGSAASRHIEASIIDTRTRQVESLLREQTLEDKVDR